MTTEAVIEPGEFFEFVAIPERRADPYPFYARLQAADPVHELGDFIWLVSGYDYVAEVLRDSRYSSDEGNSSLSSVSGFAETSFGRMTRSMLLFRDDPDHKRLRDLVQKAFTRRVVEDLRPRVDALVDTSVTKLIDNGGGDLMSDFAYPLPVTVICELLGVPPEDWPKFHAWASDFAARFEIQPLRTEEMEERGDAATANLIDYFEGLIAEKRRRPANDLISALASVEQDGDSLTHDELLSTCLLILLAGHETTANLIGNGVRALLTDRKQWEKLVSEPSLVRSAVEEILRFDPPAQMIQRVALEDITLGRRTIPKGSLVALMLAAANRDPSRFHEPDRLDITRDEAPLVAFGGGPHFCLGAPLARLETQIALGALARRAPRLDFTDAAPEWRPSFVIRGLLSFPVTTR